MSQDVHPIRPEDIHSLTDFQRKAREHVRRLQDTGRPEVLTVNGKAVLVVQDANAYQRMLDLACRMDAWLAVREGLDSMERGAGISLEEFDKEMRDKLVLPDRSAITGSEGCG